MIDNVLSSFNVINAILVEMGSHPITYFPVSSDVKNATSFFALPSVTPEYLSV